ncbi:MAG: hypothetical protein AB4290_10510 [Spirulina sp.]
MSSLLLSIQKQQGKDISPHAVRSAENKKGDRCFKKLNINTPIPTRSDKMIVGKLLIPLLPQKK